MFAINKQSSSFLALVVLLLMNVALSYPSSRDDSKYSNRTFREFDLYPSDPDPPDRGQVQVDEEPRGANPVGRYFLYNRYGERGWEAWAQTLADTYKNELRQNQIYINDDNAYAHIFTSVDADLADTLTRQKNTAASKKAARLYYEKCKRGCQMGGLSIDSLMNDSSSSSSSSNSRTRKGKGKGKGHA